MGCYFDPRIEGTSKKHWAKHGVFVKGDRCIISDEHHFVIFLVPKVGSSTLLKLTTSTKYAGKSFMNCHLPSIKKMIKPDFLRVAFVRDPWARFISAYHFVKILSPKEQRVEVEGETAALDRLKALVETTNPLDFQVTNYHYLTTSFFLSEPPTPSNFDNRSEYFPFPYVRLDLMLPIEDGLENGWESVKNELRKAWRRKSVHVPSSLLAPDGLTSSRNRNERVLVKYADLLLATPEAHNTSQKLCRYLAQDYHCLQSLYKPPPICNSSVPSIASRMGQVQLRGLMEREWQSNLSTDDVVKRLFFTRPATPLLSHRVSPLQRNRRSSQRTKPYLGEQPTLSLSTPSIEVQAGISWSEPVGSQHSVVSLMFPTLLSLFVLIPILLQRLWLWPSPARTCRRRQTK